MVEKGEIPAAGRSGSATDEDLADVLGKLHTRRAHVSAVKLHHNLPPGSALVSFLL